MVRPSNPSHTANGPAPAPGSAAGWPLWPRVGHALAGFSPWMLAFCLTGAYFTMDKPAWSGLNLTLCIAMPMIMVARLAWVLFGPDEANSQAQHDERCPPQA